MSLNEYLDRHGSPIRYSYVRESWPSSYYQTVYATEVGSAEMPSAGRAFTPELITRLVAKGVRILPLLLHTGVASLEDDEPPYEEFYRVSPETAAAINAARKAGRRIVAVGTTVVRALETVTDRDGVDPPWRGLDRPLHHPGARHTFRERDADRPARTPLDPPVDAGGARRKHVPCPLSTTGREHLEIAYSEALDRGYLWHEFGDLHLIL